MVLKCGVGFRVEMVLKCGFGFRVEDLGIPRTACSMVLEHGFGFGAHLLLTSQPDAMAGGVTVTFTWFGFGVCGYGVGDLTFGVQGSRFKVVYGVYSVGWGLGYRTTLPCVADGLVAENVTPTVSSGMNLALKLEGVKSWMLP